MLTFEVYVDKAGKWRWRLRHQNGNVIATCGGQGYENRGDLDTVLHTMGRDVRNAPIKTVAK